MIFPPSLNVGSTIGLVSPAGKVQSELANGLVNVLVEKGFNCRLSPNALSGFNQFSGTDEQRLADLQQMLDDPQVEAVICLRGGYGAMRIVDHVDLSGFMAHPKWLVGFSDITVLHAMVQRKTPYASLHGPMAKHVVDALPGRADIEALWQFLTGEMPVYEFAAHPLNRQGTANGRLVGGNLSLIYALRGTAYDIVQEGDILFIEDLNEYLYHLDRMMHNLKLGGVLSKLSGLVVGQFTDMKDNGTPFGASANEIIFDAVKEYGYPVVFGFPAGHCEPNYPLPMGAVAMVDANSLSTQITFHHG